MGNSRGKHSPYPYLIPAAGGDPAPLDAAQTIILGVIPEVEPQPATIHMQDGDTIIFATDGFTEATNDQEEEFGEERFELYLAGHREIPLSEFVSGLVNTVESFNRGCEQGDDRTVLALRVRCVDYDEAAAFERSREAPPASPLK